MTTQTEAQTDTPTDAPADPATSSPAVRIDATSGAAGQAAAAPAAQGATPNMSNLARALLAELRQRFPAFGQCLPLAIGIDKLLLAEMPDLSRKTLRVALNMHTHSSRYLKAMATATARVDLAGNPSGDVTEEHRTRASDMLKERFKKEREQRNATRVADETKRRAEEAQRKIDLEAQARADKLQQLAAKFSGKPAR